MGKTYRKNIRAFICTGGDNNGNYYTNRRRSIRRKGKNNLRHLMANYDIDEVNDLILNDNSPKSDPWNEPSDGHFTINREIIKNKDREFGYDEYYHKKFDHILKNKHYKH